MAALTHLLRDLEQIVFRNRDQHAIPSMDGALSPNDALDACEPIGEPLPDLDSVTKGPDGALYATSGVNVVRLDGPGFTNRAQLAALPGPGGGLAFHPDGRLLVCVADHGLVALDARGTQASLLREAEGVALRCLTDVAAAPDGSVFLASGSDRNRAGDWLRDLMENGGSGRLVSCDASLGHARSVRSGLRYPHGLAFAGGHLWFTESWNHRVSRIPLNNGGALGPSEMIIRNLPGYPARLSPTQEGEFWLNLFGLRTQLIEFVLREDDYREEMMRAIDPSLWIGPAYASTGHYLEPLQGGGIKKLGIQKPWAPPRSYGLVVRIDQTGRALESLHSRVGGRFHGVTAAVETEQGLVIASKGQNRLLLRAGGRNA
jgi:sugar lactone lactonase YvrE